MPGMFSPQSLANNLSIPLDHVLRRLINLQSEFDEEKIIDMLYIVDIAEHR